MQKLQNSHLSSFGEKEIQKRGKGEGVAGPTCLPFGPLARAAQLSPSSPHADASCPSTPDAGHVAAVRRRRGRDRPTPPRSSRCPHSPCLPLVRPQPLPLQASPWRHCWPSSAARRRPFRRAVLRAKSTTVFVITSVSPCARSTEVVSLHVTAMARRSSPDLIRVLRHAETFPSLPFFVCSYARCVRDDLSELRRCCAGALPRRSGLATASSTIVLPCMPTKVLWPFLGQAKGTIGCASLRGTR